MTSDHQFAIGEIAVICNMPEPVTRWNGEELAITGPCEFRKWKLITDNSIHREGLAYKGEAQHRKRDLHSSRTFAEEASSAGLDEVVQAGSGPAERSAGMNTPVTSEQCPHCGEADNALCANQWWHQEHPTSNQQLQRYTLVERYHDGLCPHMEKCDAGWYYHKSEADKLLVKQSAEIARLHAHIRELESSRVETTESLSLLVDLVHDFGGYVPGDHVLRLAERAGVKVDPETWDIVRKRAGLPVELTVDRGMCKGGDCFNANTLSGHNLDCPAHWEHMRQMSRDDDFPDNAIRDAMERAFWKSVYITDNGTDATQQSLVKHTNETEELRTRLDEWYTTEAKIHTALIALTGEDLYCKVLAQISVDPATHNPILAHANEITAKNQQIEQLQNNLRQSHAAYNSIFDAAVKLERRLHTSNIPAKIPTNTMNGMVCCLCGWTGTLWQLVNLEPVGNTKGCPTCHAEFQTLLASLDEKSSEVNVTPPPSKEIFNPMAERRIGDGTLLAYVFPDPTWMELRIDDPEDDSYTLASLTVKQARELHAWLDSAIPQI